MAVVIPLNNFLGPADDTVTAQTYYRIILFLSPKNTGGGQGAAPVDGEEECPGGTLGPDGGPQSRKTGPADDTVTS